MESVLEKAKKKVIEWASFLCGIINEHEHSSRKNIKSEEDSLSEERLKDTEKSPL